MGKEIKCDCKEDGFHKYCFMQQMYLGIQRNKINSYSIADLDG